MGRHNIKTAVACVAVWPYWFLDLPEMCLASSISCIQTHPTTSYNTILSQVLHSAKLIQNRMDTIDMEVT
jgi:hypothetical protein